MIHVVTTSGTMSGNEWQQVAQQVTMSDNEWQRGQSVVISANFPYSRIREEPTTKHPKENSLKLEEDLEERHWIKRGKKPLRRNINNKKQDMRPFLSFAIHTTLKNFEDSMTQT